MCLGKAEHTLKKKSSIWISKKINLLNPESLLKAYKDRGTYLFLGLVKQASQFSADMGASCVARVRYM